MAGKRERDTQAGNDAEEQKKKLDKLITLSDSAQNLAMFQRPFIVRFLKVKHACFSPSHCLMPRLTLRHTAFMLPPHHALFW